MQLTIVGMRLSGNIRNVFFLVQLLRTMGPPLFVSLCLPYIGLDLVRLVSLTPFATACFGASYQAYSAVEQHISDVESGASSFCLIQN